MIKEKIILDTDIGDDIDDAYALALSLKSEEIELVGVTTVFRNTFLRAKLAKYLIKTLNADVKVYAGCEFPLIEPIPFFEHEIGNKEPLAKPCQYSDEIQNEKVEKLHAVDYIINTVKANPGEITIIAIGPLTNIAMAIRKAPEIVKLLKKIVIMSGHIPDKQYRNDLSMHKPEWNVICDPEASRIVYTCGAPIYQIGLNVTMQCELTMENVALLKEGQKNSNVLLYKLTDTWSKKFNRNNPVMHDPLAVSVIANDFCTFEKQSVRVELLPSERGKTVLTDKDSYASSEIYVATSVDNLGFIEFLLEKLH